MRNQLLLLLMTFCCLSVFGQQKVYIYLAGGDTIVKNIWEIDSISFAEDSPYVSPDTAEAVDLGLSVKWANFNFGATSSDQSGLLVGWGDVTGKNMSSNLKYFPTSNPTGDIISTNYDIVKKFWGDQWRMPSENEIKELFENCTCSWTSVKGQKGYTLKSKMNGDSIFFPVTGTRYESKTTDKDSLGYLWSGSIDKSDPRKAICFKFSHSDSSFIGLDRYMGCAIRAVYGKYKYGITINVSAPSNITSSTATLGSKIGGELSDVTSAGLSFSTSKDNLKAGTGKIVEISTIPASGEILFNLTGLSPNTKYFYLVYVTHDGIKTVSDTLNFNTLVKFPVADTVNLGLSVKWASWNMGATQVGDYGGYYGWGDPSGDLISTNSFDYAADNTASNIGGTKYDIAHVQWGDKWRLPTVSEIKELENLDWSYSDNYNGTGVKGWIVKSKEHEIFIPKGGWKYDGNEKYVGESAFYWTSNLDNLDKPQGGQLFPNYISIGSYEKAIRMLIRPVYDDAVIPVVPDVPETSEAGKGVDLGLSVKWADRNIGSTVSADYGKYFAWGETVSKKDYSTSTYSLLDTLRSDGTYSKKFLGYDISGSDYDAAHILWSGTWRMPTQTEMNELIDLCTWVVTTEKNIRGFRITGHNGNSIFLPFNGYMSGINLTSVGTNGYYWTSTLYTRVDHSNDWAYRLCTVLDSNDKYTAGTYREKGFSIRPVKP